MDDLPTRDDILARTLSDLQDCYVETSCCRRTVIHAVSKIVEQRPRLERLTVADLLPRMVCQRCGTRPTSVIVTNSQTGRLPGQTTEPWRYEVELF